MNYNWDSLNKKTYNNRVGHYKFRRQFKFIVDHGANHAEKVLDIAGGSGRMAIPLLKYTKDITVVDIKPVAIQILNERNKEIKTICGNFTDLDFQSKFSLILCIEAIGQFENWDHFFKKVDSILTEDGRFIFTFTNPNSWRYFLRRLKHWNDSHRGYNLNELKQLLKSNNFEIEHMKGFNWVPLPLYSNSRLVLFFEFMEKIFRLDKWYSQSPWLLISIKKVK